MEGESEQERGKDRGRGEFPIFRSFAHPGRGPSGQIWADGHVTLTHTTLSAVTQNPEAF